MTSIEARERALTKYSPSETALREELAATYRVFAMLRWDELIYNHISVRLPDQPDHFLINPFGLHYSEVQPWNLVKINLAGEAAEETPYRVNPAGFVIHAALHRAVPDAHCVMHTHTTAGMTVASLEEGLVCNNFYAAQLHGRVAYHDYEGITVRDDEGKRIVASMGDRPLLILRNHGLLSRGRTIAQAFAYLWTLNRACELQVSIMSTGRPYLAIPDAVAEHDAKAALQFDPQYGGGQDVLDALMRLERQRR